MYFEVTKSKCLGKHGHIALTTNNTNRAIAYLKKRVSQYFPELPKKVMVNLKIFIYIKKCRDLPFTFYKNSFYRRT